MSESGKGPELGTEEEAPRQEVKTCLLCSNSLSVPSAKYQANPAAENAIGLIIARGCCGHVFHLDCLQGFLKTHDVCPVCENEEWQFAVVIHLPDYPRVGS